VTLAKVGTTVHALLSTNELPLLEAQVLAGYALGVSRIALLACPERLVHAESVRRTEELFARRRAGEPIAYLTGEREFFGLSLQVTPGVLIPRPETELLVELALERLPARRGKRVLDLGTGSGAIAIAIAHEAPDAEVIAVDSSSAALEVARSNARRHDATIRLVHSDWFEALGVERFDLIVSNPPYVAAGDGHLQQGDLRFEPQQALAGGADGLDPIRAIVSRSLEYLAPEGWLLFEHGYDQAERCRRLLRERGFAEITSWTDLAHIERVSGGRR
jgi:release factor glutamine methyltransferase